MRRLVVPTWRSNREAAWLSEVFQNVYYDAGVILNFTGASSTRVMREALDSWIEAGDCTPKDAAEIFEAIARGNAARIYPLK